MKRPNAHRPKTWFHHDAAAATPWRHRGYLPHFDQPGRIQGITIRLADSLPLEFLKRCEQELRALSEDQRKAHKRVQIAEMLDRGYGACHLENPRVASLVEDALLFFDNERYNLLCWCVMPNHVHSVIETLPAHNLDEVLHSWKSYTGNEANKILGRRGTFWQREYHDRFVRDDDHYKRVVRYVENNPVKVGLVAKAEDWRWSSAWRGRSSLGAPASSRPERPGSAGF